MANKPLQITTPVGRLVGGSLYDPKTTDFDGAPLVVKTGPNAGKPRVSYDFAVALPKTPGATHWSQEPWGGPIWALGHAAFPNGETQRPDFAWKITDGDSTVPNKKLKKPCDQEGYPGHWVLWFSSGQAPRVYNANGTQQLLEKDTVKPGYYVQVFGNVTDNKPSQSPGIYVNHNMVAFAGVGPEIAFGPDVSAAGFGQGAVLPAGATAYTGQAIAPAPGVPATGAPVPPPPPPPGAVVAPGPVMLPAAQGQTYAALIAGGWTDALLIQHGMMAAPAVAAVPPPLPVGSVPTPPPPAATVVAPPPLPVTPNPALLAVPAGVAPPPPPPPTGRVMLPAANGQTYDAMIAGGWTDALLVAHGMMAA